MGNHMPALSPTLSRLVLCLAAPPSSVRLSCSARSTPYRSPGASAVGLVNLTIGGIAAALNVVLTGSLAFALGWHFAWNMMMGHLLGLSTSGIPMSAKLVSIVPHPEKAALHGGRFGPEQSPLAPAAYLLGVAMLVAFNGVSSGFEAWEQRLMATP